MANSGSDVIWLSSNALGDIISQVNQVKKQLDQHQSTVQSVLGRLNRENGSEVDIGMSLRLNCGGSFSGVDVRSALNGCTRALVACSDESSRLSDAINRVRTHIESTEKHLITLYGGNASEAYFAPIQSDDAKNTFSFNGKDFISKAISCFGTVGEFASYIFESNNNWETLSKFLVQFTLEPEWKRVANIYRRLKNFGKGYAAKESTRRLFGFTKYSKYIDESFSASKNWWIRASTNATATFKHAVTSKASWALSLITNGFENLSEYRNGFKDKGTAIAEWFAESGLTVVMGGVGAAIAVALLPVSAPALAVAAVTTVVVVGVDTLWAYTVGKGQDEDGGNEGIAEYLGEEIVALGKKGIEGLQSAFGALANHHTTAEGTSAAWAY